MEGQEIIIQAVVNGWVVMLPVNRPQFYDPNVQMINAVVKGVKKMGSGRDEVLEEIQERNEKLTDAKDPNETIAVPKSDNIFIFKTLSEVLAFLKFKIEDKAMA